MDTLSLSPSLVLAALLLYFGLLLAVGWWTGRKANDNGYFLGNRQSLWYLVALGMLSDSMSGVSFISVPGAVWKANFGYLQVVMGYVLGYLAIAYWLLPLYYKHNLTSIYTYLEGRFGMSAQRTGSLFFVVSRLLGAAGRLYLTAAILQTFLFGPWGIPFGLSVSLIIALILLYTFKGGISTLVITDALQSTFLIGGLSICIYALYQGLPLDLREQGFVSLVRNSPHSEWLNLDPWSKSYFWKHFLGGAAICIAMTGLDQNMMQKNLSCRSLKDAQKNMVATAVVVFLVNVFFLSLGVLMIEFLKANADPLLQQVKDGKALTDSFFPHIALSQLGPVAGLSFVLGLAAATFSSADSVLTTLTTSTYFDLWNLDARGDLSVEQKLRYRRYLHIGFAVALWASIMAFKAFNQQALIDTVLDLANYTYGPLLGLFFVGMFTSWKPSGKALVLACLASPVLIYGLKQIPFQQYQFGFELLIINGAITALLLGLAARLRRA